MPFCPQCRIPYRQGFSQCSECGASLVASLPDLPEGEETLHEFHLVKVVEFLTPTEAAMIRELLEENGIPALVQGQSDPLGIVSGAQPVALLVAEDDLEQATEIYEAFFDRVGREDHALPSDE